MSNGGPATKIRCTNRQKDFLVNYMVANPSFARGEYLGPLRVQELDDEWMRLKDMLSEIGPDKPVLAWKRTWRDLKKKARLRKKQAQITSNNPASDYPLKETDAKILTLIGSDFSANDDMKSPPNSEGSERSTLDSPVPTQQTSRSESVLASDPLGSREERPRKPRPSARGVAAKFTHLRHKNNQLLKCIVLELKVGNDLKREQNNILRDRNDILKQFLQRSETSSPLSEELYLNI